jgi:hypothetical protein
MKIKLFLCLLLSSFTFLCIAQSSKIIEGIKPYKVVIKTKDSTIRGLFLKIDSQNVTVYDKDKFVSIKTSDIKSIKLRVTKPSYQLKSYIFSATAKNDYNRLNSDGKWVDKWGNEEPTLGEQAGMVFFGVIGEGIANGIVGTLHNINPNIAHYKFKKGFDYNELESLSYYSVYYQQNPNTLAELKKIKSLTAGFKP